MQVVHDFALLAPVPHEHLESGRPVAEKTGFVAFGTNKWELFRKLDDMREGDPVPVLIYPSDEGIAAKASFIVRWFGWYIDHVESNNGRHPKGMSHRPPSTEKYAADNIGHWAAFWHVKGLHELPPEKRVSIGKIQSYAAGGWRKNAPPRGPELVILPEILSYES
jgi:hypothetical protein